MDLSYNEDKEKRKKAASDGGEDDQMLRAGGKHGEVWFWRRCRGHKLQTCLFTDSGKLMEKWEIPTDTSEQGEHIIEHVAASLERRQRERGLADEQIIGVGIDTPGIGRADGVVRGCCEIWDGRHGPGAGAVKDAPAEKGFVSATTQMRRLSENCGRAAAGGTAIW